MSHASAWLEGWPEEMAGELEAAAAHVRKAAEAGDRLGITGYSAWLKAIEPGLRGGRDQLVQSMALGKEEAARAIGERRTPPHGGTER